MKVILDTNVFVSGVFFSGPPYQILQAWSDKAIELVVSPEIIEEYQRVVDILGEQFPEVDLDPIIDLLIVDATVVSAPALPQQVCTDRDDDKFLACALASNTRLVVSGDKHLLNASGYHGIGVLRPRSFVEEFADRWS